MLIVYLCPIKMGFGLVLHTLLNQHEVHYAAALSQPHH